MLISPITIPYVLCHSERSEESKNKKILRFTQYDIILMFVIASLPVGKKAKRVIF